MTNQIPKFQYIDFKDPNARFNYIENAPEILPGIPVQPISTDPVLLPPIQKEKKGKKKEKEKEKPVKEKRKYISVTNKQRDLMIKYFQIYGDTWTASQYSTTIGINKKQSEKFLVMLRNQESIYPMKHYQKKEQNFTLPNTCVQFY